VTTYVVPVEEWADVVAANARLDAENAALRARVAELTEIAGLCKTETLLACARVEALEGLLRNAGEYVTHNDECELGRTPGVDTCTCGYFDMRDRARAALTPKGGET
jgi:hypothetical protein